MIEGITDNEICNLLRVFNSIENLYKISKTKFLFRQVLSDNNVAIQNEVFYKLTDSQIKQDLNNLCKKLEDNKVEVLISQEQKYNKLFFYLKEYQNAVFSIGNKKLLENKNIMLFKNDIFEEETNNYAEKIYSELRKEIDNEKRIRVELLNDVESLVSVFKNSQKLDNIIFILNEKITESMLEKIDRINLKNTLILFTMYNFSDKYKEFNDYLLSCIVDNLVLIEAKYTKRNVEFIDNVLNHGKNIYVVPGNIFNSSNYFSNYLIKLGANIILSNRDIKDI